MLIAAAFLSVAISAGEAGVNDKPASDPARQLFAQHCQKCHSGSKPKGDFQIDGLSLNFSDRKNREQWLTVLEQLKTGGMPPEKEPRPPALEIEAVIKWISDRARTAEAAQRTANGRVVMRRLNRSEYANTMRDLLGVEVDIADLLPPDTSTSGFDNSAEMLHTSSYLLRNYIDAADRFLDEAIANKPRPWQVNKKFDIKQETTVKPIGSVYRHIDDGVAIFASWESANIRVTMWNFQTHFRGKYRFRISGYGFQSDGKPVNFHVTAGTLKEVTEERLIDYFAVPANKPTVIEFTEQLEVENRIRIIADGLPAQPPAIEKIGADKYTGPGLVIQWVEVEGPLMTTWPPPSHVAIFGDLKQAIVPGPNDPKRLEVVSPQPLADAERILRNFAQRAFRRAVAGDEVAPFVARVKARLEQKYSFEQAMRVGLRAILISPDFLFLREKTTSGTTLLDDDALASRLSYFLWSSMPDEALFKLAEAHTLHEPAVLCEQVERLLRDPKSKAFTENFTGQWLSLRAIDNTMPDHTLYPEYDDILKVAMVQGSGAVLRRSFEERLEPDELRRLRFHIPQCPPREALRHPRRRRHGDAKSRSAAHESSRRGADDGQYLKSHANGTTTSPILRGAWVLERILGTPPPKPPADVEAIEPDIRGATTIREQLTKHRKVATCASCHSKIDPPGFALESFDVTGGWRDHYRATGELKDINGRKERVWQGPAVDQVTYCPMAGNFGISTNSRSSCSKTKISWRGGLAEKLLAYSTGAAPGKGDAAEIEKIVERVRGKNYGFKALMQEVVQSGIFRE